MPTSDGTALMIANSRIANRIMSFVPLGRVQIVAALSISLVVSACTTSVRCGDARRVHPASILFMMVDYLEFPKVPLGERKAFSFHVTRCKGDAVIFYPKSLRVRIPTTELDLVHPRQDQPWRSTLLRVSLVEPDGRKRYDQEINLATDWKGGAEVGSKYSKLWLKLPGDAELASLESYTLKIEVLRPSGRKSDALEISSEY